MIAGLAELGQVPLPRVWEHYPDTHLVVVGMGPQEAELRRIARDLTAQGRIHLLTRRLSRAEIANCYAGADLFVFPSCTETQGIIIGEAQAAGLPVVAINAWGVGSLIRHGVDGWLCPPDAEAFAAAIVSLLADKELRVRLGAAGKEAVRSISAPKMAARLLEAYESLRRRSSGLPGRPEEP